MREHQSLIALLRAGESSLATVESARVGRGRLGDENLDFGEAHVVDIRHDVVTRSAVVALDLRMSFVPDYNIAGVLCWDVTALSAGPYDLELPSPRVYEVGMLSVAERDRAVELEFSSPYGKRFSVQARRIAVVVGTAPAYSDTPTNFGNFGDGAYTELWEHMPNSDSHLSAVRLAYDYTSSQRHVP